MRNIIFICLFLSSWSAHSQNFNRYKSEKPASISASIGGTQYFGDLYSFGKNNAPMTPRWNANIGFRYTVGSHLRVRGDFSYVKIAGGNPSSDPRYAPQSPNLHFEAQNWEASSLLEYYWHPVKTPHINRSFWNPYLFVGMGMTTNRPKTLLRDEWIDLQPFQLENNPYERFTVTFPMGLGVKYKLNLYLDLTLEMNYRMTLTDYLDDVSAFNVNEFYKDLVADYGTHGDGPHPDRLRLAIRDPNFLEESGEPDVDKILRNGGRYRRGTGLNHLNDSYLTFNAGIEIYLSKEIFRNSTRNKNFRFW